MLENLFLVFVFIILALPFLFVGYLIETKQAKKRKQLDDEIARQSYNQTISKNNRSS